jgi:hypothetical protein
LPCGEEEKEGESQVATFFLAIRDDLTILSRKHWKYSIVGFDTIPIYFFCKKVKAPSAYASTPVFKVG